VHLLPEDLPDVPFGVAAGNKMATRPTETDRNATVGSGTEILSFAGETPDLPRPTERAVAHS